MRETEAQDEADELVEECVDLMQKYTIGPTTGKLGTQWLKSHLRLYERDLDDFGAEVNYFVRHNYVELSEVMPRDVCSLLNRLVDAWCVGDWDESPHSPTGTETNLYLVLANHFWFDPKRFSHLAVIEKLEDVYGFMVDREYEKIPGVKATMGSKERRYLRDKWVRKYIREHPEVKEMGHVG